MKSMPVLFGIANLNTNGLFTMRKVLVVLAILLFVPVRNYAQYVALNPSGNQTVTQPSGTTLSISSLNSVYNVASCGTATPPAWCSGSDIGTWINAAFSACSDACTVYVPSGQYSYKTTISFPAKDTGNVSLQCAPGTKLMWTGGSGDLFAVLGTGQSKIGHILDGCIFVGNSSATAGVHLRAVSGGKISNIITESLPNGDGILNEGANTIDYDSVISVGNRNNVHNVGVSVSGGNYSANAIHFRSGGIVNASQWGAFEDGSQAAITGPNQNNTYDGVAFEANGGSSNYGQVFLQSCDMCALTHNYFELSSTQSVTSQIVVGDTSHYPNNPVFIGNFFGTNGATVTNELYFDNVAGAVVAFNFDPSGTTPNFVNTNTTAQELQVEYNIIGGIENYTAGTGSFNLIWNSGGLGPTFANTVTVTRGGYSVAAGNIADSSGNIYAGTGTTVVYRCVTAGTLPIGALTTQPSECGSTAITGLRVK
jgi:hypothetical protein